MNYNYDYYPTWANPYSPKGNFVFQEKRDWRNEHPHYYWKDDVFLENKYLKGINKNLKYTFLLEEIQKLTSAKKDLEIFCEKLQNDLKKFEALEKELQTLSVEKKNLEMACENLQTQLRIANNQIS